MYIGVYMYVACILSYVMTTCGSVASDRGAADKSLGLSTITEVSSVDVSTKTQSSIGAADQSSAAKSSTALDCESILLHCHAFL